MKVPSITLNSGEGMPQIGLGLWKIKKEKDCLEAVSAALEVGYRHFDTAQIYGNVKFFGKALKASNVDRQELFITTKIWNENLYWDDVLPSFDESLTNLQTDYVDLLLIHFPVTELRRPAWHKLEEIQQSGRAKSIGVSNYTVRHLEELLKESKVKPAVNQVELHVYLQQPELRAYCKQHHIAVEAYSPLAHGNGLDNEVLSVIAKKHRKTNAQIMLRWCIQQGTVPLPKSTHPTRIQENIEIFDLELDDEDLQQIRQLERNYRTCWDPTNTP